MQEVWDRARLVEPSEIGAREIQATVRRAEIEGVLRSKDGDPELVIDVTRSGEAEARTFRLAWDPSDLEELLRKAEGDEVTLTFNGSQLEQAFESDVEAHGLREAAVVLAVAATTAAAGATVGQASTGPVAQSGGTAVTAQAQSTQPGVVSEREWPQVVPASTTPAPVSEREWPELVPGTAAPSADTTSTQPGVVSEREWPQVVPASTTPAPVSEREWPQVVPGSAATTPPPVSATGGNSSVGSDLGTAGAVAGGAVLLIAAAGFAVRRRGDIQPRPA